jgi:hypothetical protein
MVTLRNGQPQSLRCHPCGARHRADTQPARSRENHPRWKGGRHVAVNGYLQVVVPLDSPYLPMADDRGRVYEHRLVVAESLGRCLTAIEEVHHINADKHDNRLSNLRMLSKGEHSREHHDEIRQLRAEVRRLRAELRQALSSRPI